MRVARVAWLELAVQVGLVAPAGRPDNRPAERVRSAQAARLVISAVDARPGSSDSVVRRADRWLSDNRSAAVVVLEAVDVPVVDVAGGVRGSSMGAPKSWLCSILAAILWTGIVQAAPTNAPEPQRSFASAEDAAKAFVAALRDNKKTDLRAMLGLEADRVIDSGDWYGDQEFHQRFVALYEEKHTIDEKVPGARS